MELEPLIDSSSFAENAVTEQTARFNDMLVKLRVGLLDVPQNAGMLRARYADYARKAAGGQVYVSPRAKTEQSDDGAHQRLLRVWIPQKPMGVVVFIHGGGWVMGAPEGQDARLEELVDQGFVVVAPKYRLAPEDPFPAGLDDCEAAVRWTCTRFSQFADQGCMAIIGESSGANLAVAAALRLRDRPGPARIGALVLLYGVYDLTMTPSQRLHGDVQGLLGTSLMAWFIDQYVEPRLRREPLVSPLFADLRGLPPALFLVGTRDLLVDDSLFMHARWIAAGGESALQVAPGGVHAFNYYPLEIAAEANRSVVTFLKRRCTGG